MLTVSHQLKTPSHQISKEADYLFEQAKLVVPVAHARISSSLWDNKLFIDSGFNSLKTHPFQKKYGNNEHCIHLHAEIDVLVKASRSPRYQDLKGTTMVVVRAKKASQRGPFVWGLARPCAGCRRAIVAFGIKEVWYSTDQHGVLECL